jgi:hypothetical protein
MTTLMFAVIIDTAGGAPPKSYRRRVADVLPVAQRAVFGPAAAGLPSSARRRGLSTGKCVKIYKTTWQHKDVVQHY